MGSSVGERLQEVRVWRFGIIDIGPERQALVAPALHRCVLGTVSPARSVDPVLLAEYLGDVGCNRVDDRAQAWLVQPLVVRPFGPGMRIEQAVGAESGLVALADAFPGRCIART